jgi:hypothetical protein
VVEFEPSNEGDEDLADDVTEAMHYIYRRKSGYRLIHDWAKAGLLGEDRRRQVVRRAQAQAGRGPVSPGDDAGQRDPGAGDRPAHPVDGAPMIHAVTLEETAATFPDYHVPLEEFSFSPDTTRPRYSPYLNHHPMKTLSELVEMGFDARPSRGFRAMSGLTDFSGLATGTTAARPGSWAMTARGCCARSLSRGICPSTTSTTTALPSG